MKSQSRDIVEDVDGQSKITDAPIKIATDTVPEKETSYEIAYLIGINTKTINQPMAVFSELKEAEEYKLGVIRENGFDTGTSYPNAVYLMPIPYIPKKEL